MFEICRLPGGIYCTLKLHRVQLNWSVSFDDCIATIYSVFDPHHVNIGVPLRAESGDTSTAKSHDGPQHHETKAVRSQYSEDFVGYNAWSIAVPTLRHRSE